MDVTAPAAPSRPPAQPTPAAPVQSVADTPQPLVMHEPPKQLGDDTASTPGQQPDPPPQPEKQSRPDPSTSEARPKPAAKHQVPKPPLPVGAIVIAVFAMIALSALAIATYLQS